MRRRLALVVAIVLVAVVLGACGDDTDSSATRSEVLHNLGSRVIAPSYERLDRATSDLSDAVNDLCAAPEATRLADAQEAWERAWEAWNRTRAFRFGPATDTRATSDIAFMTNTTKIDSLLAGADSALGPPFSASTLAETGSDVRGLGAVEHVLFDADPTSAAACSYAAAAAELASTAAHSVSAAWNDGSDGEAPYVRQLANPGTGAYPNAQAAIDDLVNGVAMALTETTRELANADAAPPDERDIAGRHGGSRVRDVLWSVSAMYLGSDNGTDGAGIDDLVAAVSPASDERVRDFIERATRSTDQLPAALSEASKPQLRRAYRLVRNSGTIVRAEVASELGVTLSLGDSDGDS